MNNQAAVVDLLLRLEHAAPSPPSKHHGLPQPLPERWRQVLHLFLLSVSLSISLHGSADEEGADSGGGDSVCAAKLTDPGYALELSSPVPYMGLPKATLKFPLGEVSIEEKEEKEKQNMLSINGIVKGRILNGLCTAHYADEDLKLRYLYKDKEMSLIPTICLPSNALSFAFKRQFGPSDKLRNLDFLWYT
ncbi:hypothetical protein ACFX16_046718 [Malus domestica]